MLKNNLTQPLAGSGERTEGFWQHHLGTDRQWGAFLWCVACVFYGAAEAVLLVSFTEGYDDDLMGGGGTTIEEINATSQLVAAALFLWGSWRFFKGSYPAALDASLESLKGLDGAADGLSWAQRYFTHSDELLGSWLFVLACLPYLVVGAAFLLLDSPSSFFGWTYMLGGAGGAGLLAAWAATLMPEYRAMNGGEGSNVLFETLCCAPCHDSPRVRETCENDFVFAVWCLCGALAVIAPCSIALAVWSPTVPDLCLTASVLVLTWGVAAYAHGHEGGASVECNPAVCCCGAPAFAMNSMHQSHQMEREVL